METKKNAQTKPKTKRPKMTDEEVVQHYMDALEHPLKTEIEAVRAIIKSADPKISERIKWNAPSYYYQEDMVTFNHRATDQVHLVFHHPFIVQIDSALLLGDYKDRRMMYFKDMVSVEAHKNELEKIMQTLVQHIDHK